MYYCVIMISRLPSPTLFPYTTLFRSETAEFHLRVRDAYLELAAAEPERIKVIDTSGPVERTHDRVKQILDRKSTRLNSSHLVISYAVLCLKKIINNNYNIL